MRYLSKRIILTSLIMGNLIGFTLALMKVTNMECKALSSIIEVNKCRIEVISRGLSAVSMKMTLKQKLNNVTIDFKLLKKSNSWKKFFIDKKNVDLCDFVKNRKRYGFINIMFELMKPYSNLNHSCPYESGIVIVDRLPFNENNPVLNNIPIGEYALVSTWYAYGAPMLSLSGHLTYTDYRKNW